MFQLYLRRSYGSLLLLKSRIYLPQCLKGRNFSTSINSKEKEAELVKDVILYRHENPSFPRYVGLFGFLQFTFWGFLGSNMLYMKDIPIEPNPDTSYWKRINWGENNTKKLMASASFFMANFTLMLSWFFIIRSVRYIVLRKTRDIVSVVTFTPFQRNRFIEVPLKNISCQGSRTDRTFMPIKIKGKYFMFVVDLREGFHTFPNTLLFDQTVGIHRKF